MARRCPPSPNVDFIAASQQSWPALPVVNLYRLSSPCPHRQLPLRSLCQPPARQAVWKSLSHPLRRQWKHRRFNNRLAPIAIASAEQQLHHIFNIIVVFGAIRILCRQLSPSTPAQDARTMARWAENPEAIKPQCSATCTENLSPPRSNTQTTAAATGTSFVLAGRPNNLRRSRTENTGNKNNTTNNRT